MGPSAHGSLGLVSLSFQTTTRFEAAQGRLGLTRVSVSPSRRYEPFPTSQLNNPCFLARCQHSHIFRSRMLWAQGPGWLCEHRY